jgi:hypothetical protein
MGITVWHWCLIYCDMSTLCWMTQRSCWAPASKQGFRADAMMSRNSIGIRFLRNSSAQLRWRHMCLHGCQEMSRHLVRHNSGRTAYGSSPRNRQRNNAMTIAMRPLTQLGYISEAISRFSSVPGVTVKKSVIKKQWIRGMRSRRVVRSVTWRLCVCDSVW